MNDSLVTPTIQQNLQSFFLGIYKKTKETVEKQSKHSTF